MRIFDPGKTPIAPRVKSILEKCSKMFGVSDEDFDVLQDLFCMMQGNRSNSSHLRIRAKEICSDPSSGLRESSVMNALSSRVYTLESLINTKYAQMYVQNGYSDEDSIESILTFYRGFSPNSQFVHCHQCPLRSDCDYGSLLVSSYGALPMKSYGQYADLASLPIGSVLNDYQINELQAKDVHDDCPYPPAQDLIGTIKRISQDMNALDGPDSGALVTTDGKTPEGTDASVEADKGLPDANAQGETGDAKAITDDQYAGPGKSSIFDSTFAGAKMNPKTFENFLKKVSMQSYSIHKLSGKLNSQIENEGSRDLIDSEVPDKGHLEIETVDDIGQLRNANRAQLASPMEDTLAKLQTGDITRIQHKVPSKRKSLYYILIDTSGSMSGALGSNSYGLTHRGALAAAVAISIAKAQFNDNGLFFLRFFAGAPDRLRVADTSEKFKHICRMISINDSNGGGTSVCEALRAAHDDITNGAYSSIIRKAEILAITDGDDNVVDQTLFKEIQKNIGLHYLEIRSSDSTIGKWNPNSPTMRTAFAHFGKSSQVVTPDTLDITKAKSR